MGTIWTEQFIREGSIGAVVPYGHSDMLVNGKSVPHCIASNSTIRYSIEWYYSIFDRMVLFDIRSNGAIRYSIEWYYSIFDRMVLFDIRSNGTIRYSIEWCYSIFDRMVLFDVFRVTIRTIRTVSFELCFY